MRLSFKGLFFSGILLSLICLESSLVSAPSEHSFNPHLIYLRLHSLPADLPTDTSVLNKTCILDLRNLKATDEDAKILGAFVSRHATVKTPFFILQNEETSYSLVIPYKPSNLQALGIITLGPTVARIPAEIQIDVTSQDDHKAYLAFESGTTLESLITPKIDKVRDDEERLDKEHLSDNSPRADLDINAIPSPATLIDPVLQRAYYLALGLVALKRLN